MPDWEYPSMGGGVYMNRQHTGHPDQVRSDGVSHTCHDMADVPVERGRVWAMRADSRRGNEANHGFWKPYVWRDPARVSRAARVSAPVLRVPHPEVNHPVKSPNRRTG